MGVEVELVEDPIEEEDPIEGDDPIEEDDQVEIEEMKTLDVTQEKPNDIVGDNGKLCEGENNDERDRNKDFAHEYKVEKERCEDEEYNKWYPFNRKQLREHDPRAYELLKRLWKVDFEEKEWS